MYIFGFVIPSPVRRIMQHAIQIEITGSNNYVLQMGIATWAAVLKGRRVGQRFYSQDGELCNSRMSKANQTWSV